MKTPRPYQSEAILSCMTQNTLICDEPGLGKTLEGILGGLAFTSTLEAGHCDLPKLVICRKRKRSDWVDEINDLTPDIPAIILDKAPSVPIRYPVWLVTHYEAISTSGRQWSMLGNFACVILDEAHNIKNGQSKRARAIKQIKTLRKIAITGTPIDSSAVEAWSVLNWLYPHDFSSYREFFDTHANYKIVYTKRGPQQKAVAGVRDAVEFAKAIGKFTFQRTKKQVAKWLPDKTIKVKYVPMGPSQRKIYDLIDKSDDIELTLPSGQWLFIPNELTRITRLQQVTSSATIIGIEADSAKIEWLFDYIRNNPRVPAVIFTKFTQTAKIIASELNCPGIYGDSKDVPDPFVDGAVNQIVGTIDAMGDGFNFGRGKVTIYVDLHWSSIKMGQSIERTHRMTETERKYVIYLITPGTVDEDIYNVFMNKWSEQRLIGLYINRRKKT